MRLVVAGEGALREAMDIHARELGLAERVHFVGDQARDELAELMRATDVLLLSSRTEGGGPRVVLEALASGVPVVATPVGDVGRTVRSGVNGWLTAAHDAAELADGLEWALDQPSTRFATSTCGGRAVYGATRARPAVCRLSRADPRRGRRRPAGTQTEHLTLAHGVPTRRVDSVDDQPPLTIDARPIDRGVRDEHDQEVALAITSSRPRDSYAVPTASVIRST